MVDGGTLQLGIGSLGDAVAQALILRQRRNADFRDILARLDPAGSTPAGLRESAPFEAGLHGVSEMFVEGFLDLMRAGILKREVDGTLLQAAFFLGSRAFYRALREMPEPELAKLRMTSVSFVNELYGDEAAKRRARVKARFINNAMMATLLGAVVSDALEDGRVVSGVGGQYNFVAQSFALEDARSVIMLRATRAAKGRTTSNIRWNYGHTTIPRHLRDIVVTEYGVADLRGKTDRDVIAAMLAVTDSRFQDELLRRAKDAGKIEKAFELPAACRDNTPERIARALAPAREQGLLPLFPFGTDFTETEQRLIPALQLLEAASPHAPRRTAGARACVRGAVAAGARMPGAHGARAAIGPDRARLCRAAARRLGRFHASSEPRSSLSLLHFHGRHHQGSQSMTISLYKISVPIFVQFLTSLSAVLDKAAAFAEAKKVDPSVLLNTRLAPDMFPLVRQVRAATDHAINACGRLAGAELPTFSNTEATIPELKERIAKTIDFLKSLKPAQIDGTEGKEIKITFPSGATREFTGQSLLLNNSLPNFYFHCTTAYDILRQCGVELGKRDFMGTPVSM